LQNDSIERIRSATFSISRKGYDKREVERFLNKLADWLEAGGGDQARSDLVKRELERVGEKTARILSEAEDSGEQLRTEAQEEAGGTLNRAKEQATSTRQAADEYATRTRQTADQYRDKTRKAAERSAQEMRARSTQEAREAIDDAQSKARRIVEEGAKRRGDIEAVIGDLVRHRDTLLSGLDQLTSELKTVVTGHSPPPGGDPFATPKEFDPEDRPGTERVPAAEPAARERDEEPASAAVAAAKPTRSRKRARPAAKE
jgi:DivIVA domain-containing protein